jgi:acetyltransferase-like isoleucine patch superfamily enzyme
MSGRTIFDKLKGLFFLMDCFMKLMPRFFRSGSLNIFSGFPLKIGMLLRYVLFHSLCDKCGDNVYIGRWCTLKNVGNIKFGDNISIHEYCYLDGEGGITIGDNVSIAHGSSVLSSNHSWNNLNIPIKYNKIEVLPVKIEDDVWIGCGVRILAGVTIHSRSIVAAGAVVTTDVPPNSIVAGVPAKVIKNI